MRTLKALFAVSALCLTTASAGASVFTCGPNSPVRTHKMPTVAEGGPGMPPHVCHWITSGCPEGKAWRQQGSPRGVRRPADHTCLWLPGRAPIVKREPAPKRAVVASPSWDVAFLQQRCDRVHLVDRKPMLRDEGGVGLPPRICLLVRDERCRSQALTAWLLEGSRHGERRKDNGHVCKSVPVGIRYVQSWDKCVRDGRCEHPAHRSKK